MASSDKIYIVVKGRRLGFFTTWNECNSQVKGFSGASFWSIKTNKLPDSREELIKYLLDNGVSQDTLPNYLEHPYIKKRYSIDNTDSIINGVNSIQSQPSGDMSSVSFGDDNTKSVVLPEESQFLTACCKKIDLVQAIENFNVVPLNTTDDASVIDLWVDGSFNNYLSIVGSGVYICQGQLAIYDIDFRTTNIDLVKEHQCSGEVLAVVGALTYLEPYIKQGIIKNIRIYYDYSGIEMWYNNVINKQPMWQAKAVSSSSYISFLQEFTLLYPGCELSFHKVTAHTGIPANDRADILAKRGAGIFV